MNSSIANILKTKLEVLPFVDTIAGLVTVGQKKNKTEVLRFPISRDVTHTDCINGRYTDLIPNDKKTSIIYFEDRGISNAGLSGSRTIYESNLTLVGWLNLKKIGKQDIEITSLVVGSILKVLKMPKFNDGMFQRIDVKVDNQLVKNTQIFSDYTFRREAQYMMFPFDYFALNLTVTFEIDTNCINDFVMGVEDDCLNC
jgi:hypothetical protein